MYIFSKIRLYIYKDDKGWYILLYKKYHVIFKNGEESYLCISNQVNLSTIISGQKFIKDVVDNEWVRSDEIDKYQYVTTELLEAEAVL